MKILNLYAGIGGNRKLWADEHDITAVEINSQIANCYKELYPMDTVLIQDAHEYLLNNFNKYDFIWSSPPCQTHSKMQRINSKRYGLFRYPDMKLYQEIIFLSNFCKSKYVIENVKPYYPPLIEPNCKLNRHYLWCNFEINYHEKMNINSFIDAKYDDLKKWLGFENFNKKIYIEGSHSPVQVLRNCVHPKTGLHILNCAIDQNYEEPSEQQSLFK